MKTKNALLGCLVCGWLFAFILALPVTGAQPAGGKQAAQQKPRQASGSVVNCDDKTLVIRIRKGEEVKFIITSETRFGSKGSIKSAADFKPGNHVQVTYVRGQGGDRILKQVVPVIKHID